MYTATGFWRKMPLAATNCSPVQGCGLVASADGAVHHVFGYMAVGCVDGRLDLHFEGEFAAAGLWGEFALAP
jgi:hypothetical protein